MIILVMGVSGAGKTTISQLLAESLNWEFSDADTFHSPANLEKMRRGIPLDDADRMPWLQDLQTAIQQWLKEDKNVVLACSSLKASYRQFLLFDNRIQLVYLKGTFEILQKRLQERQNHFMTAKLLQSQFDALEEPVNAICVEISEPPEVIVKNLRAALGI
ncbi:gluconate kinase, SKI family [Cylindrospermum stagnale PCC 7417]|uniref:Gluconokinase n=1 Tax=Cylindrospermum stagnale PCC 7417 TaxID=56107 RepID=K9WVU0_9NOST|nr:gluconokinase [Cylindrospermum stagnale]AFZ23916.1 gluconate kinase, SKI family [Cylindrospermum stagnale PCC 7417]